MAGGQANPAFYASAATVHIVLGYSVASLPIVLLSSVHEYRRLSASRGPVTFPFFAELRKWADSLQASLA